MEPYVDDRFVSIPTSLQAYGAFNVKKAFSPPVHAKTDEQKSRIKDVLVKSHRA